MTVDEARIVLGVAADASADEVRRAYGLRSRMMHPDRFAGRPESEVRLATAEFQRLTAARDALLGAGWISEPPPARGADESAEVSIDVALATAGGTVEVTTAAGQQVTVRLPAGTSDGTRLRVPGRAAPVSDGTPGDLYLTVRVRRGRSESFEEFVRRRDAEDWGTVPAQPRSRTGVPPAQTGGPASERESVTWPFTLAVASPIVALLSFVVPEPIGATVLGILALILGAAPAIAAPVMLRPLYRPSLSIAFSIVGIILGVAGAAIGALALSLASRL